MWPLTSTINKVSLCLRGGWWQQLIIVLVWAEGTRVVSLAGPHHGVGHHDMAQRVIQIAVQQAALVFGRRHVVLCKRCGLGCRAKTRIHTHAHHGGALLLDHALVHGLVELLWAALCSLGVVSIYTSKKTRSINNILCWKRAWQKCSMFIFIWMFSSFTAFIIRRMVNVFCLFFPKYKKYKNSNF